MRIFEQRPIYAVAVSLEERDGHCSFCFVYIPHSADSQFEYLRHHVFM
jgi:hypothetical protein